MEWLGSKGYPVYFPIGHSPDVDLVTEIDGELTRVQVKTSTAVVDARYWVAVCTRGGNQSWSGLVKRFSPSRCDWLFVLVGDGRRWFIASVAVEGTTAIVIGGPKYSEYEVERGRPLTQPMAA